MSDRRMISRRIVECAKFLKMPLTSQNLYFHLVVNADDDGVVEAYSVINLCRASEEDLETLEERGFVDVLNDDLVTYIELWRNMNSLRADRKNDSIYIGLLQEARPDVEILKKKTRSDRRTGEEKADEAYMWDRPEDVPPAAHDDLCDGDGPAVFRRGGPISVSGDGPGTVPGLRNPSQSNQGQDKTDKERSDQIKSVSLCAQERYGDRGDSAVSGDRGENGDSNAGLRLQIARQISLPDLRSYAECMGPAAEQLMTKVYAIICATVCVPRESVTISRKAHPWQEIRDLFLKLRYENVLEIFQRLLKRDVSVQNLSSYVITSLYYEVADKAGNISACM